MPATVGLVVIAPLVPRLAAKMGGRQTIGAGFVVTTAGFVAMGLVDASWKYAAFLLPLVAIAVGMGLANGPASSAATAAVPEKQVGEASGVSNMARYVGAAVVTALAATIYGTVIGNRTADGESQADALAAGLAGASWLMAVFSCDRRADGLRDRPAPGGQGHVERCRGVGGRAGVHLADLGHGGPERTS